MKTPLRLLFSLLILGPFAAAARADALSDAFASPPASARPWVYWTWVNSNVTRESITADLESMARVGLGGALLLDIGQGAPAGPVKFYDEQWRSLFEHAVNEAGRLGLELSIGNGPGCGGSGGPWITPELGMQGVYQTEHAITGGKPWHGMLQKPVDRPDYKDIAVLAFPGKPLSPETGKIPGLTLKALQWKTWIAYTGIQQQPATAEPPGQSPIRQDTIVDLSNRMDADGKIQWTPPAGDWIIVRIGHAWTGSTIEAAATTPQAIESDKLNPVATAKHFAAFAGQLVASARPGSALKALHIDSWSGGAQNWTPGMRAIFMQRRGYDPVPFLPVLGGRIVESQRISERFLWDLRQTVSELMCSNYVAEMTRLAQENGLRLSFQSYTTIGNDLDSASHVEEPMAEFWTSTGQGADFFPSTRAMASAARLRGNRIVAAEAFCSGPAERWLWHPAMLKSLGDEAFCQGINRLVIHRFAAQPFPDRTPGVQAGTSGLHYERTNTWWEWSRPWHDYLSRCQFMLRQGEPVAEILQLQPEEPLYRTQLSPVPGYDYDICSASTLSALAVKDGRLVLPTSRSYRLLMLQNSGPMTLTTLRHLQKLVCEGATILGAPPKTTPGLSDYPESDAQLSEIARELWGEAPSDTPRKVGRGLVFHGNNASHAMVRLGIAPDFESDREINWIHRNNGPADIFFLSNPTDAPVSALCSFRLSGKMAELWNPETGRILNPYPGTTDKSGRTTLSIPFSPSGSWFVVFRPVQTRHPDPQLSRVTINKLPLYEQGGTARAANPFNLTTGAIRESGACLLEYSDGSRQRFKIPLLPADEPIEGDWTFQRLSQDEKSAPITLPGLESWSSMDDPETKFHAGEALYTKTFDITKEQLGKNCQVMLDLGEVAAMARVSLNGQFLGLLWRKPFEIDITAGARPGANQLEITVVNLWPNRLIGDERLPEDSDRNPNGALKSWPDWLLAGQDSPTGRKSFCSWRQWKRDDRLQPSGLLGPVVIRTSYKLPVIKQQTTPKTPPSPRSRH